MIHLRPAILDDVAASTACVCEAFRPYVERVGRPPAPMLDDYARVIATRSVFVAERDREVIGVLVLTTTDEGFLLENVAVRPRHRGQGVGRLLLEFAEAEARRQGHRSIRLYTHERMTEARALYARIGYGEYDRRTEDGYARVYLRKSLPAG